MARSRSPSRSASLTTASTMASMSRGTSVWCMGASVSAMMVSLVITAYAIAFCVEEQRCQHLDLNLVTHRQVGVRVDQRHDVGAVAHPDVQVALVAEVLDPADPAGRRPGAPLAFLHAHMLGAHADGCRLLGR